MVLSLSFYLSPCTRCLRGLRAASAKVALSSLHTSAWSWLDQPADVTGHHPARCPSETAPTNESRGNHDISLEQAVRLSRQGCSDHEGPAGNENGKSNFQRVKSCKISDSQSDKGWNQPNGLNTGIQIYNTLTRSKEPLVLPNGRVATWYACGPTVYDHAHIGHASSYVRSDIIRRILENHFHIDVVMVMGVTDIDDKIINRARESGTDYKQLAHKFEMEFFKDMDRMNVLPPTVKTRVTEHIPEIISFIERILQNGSAYTAPSGSVYFDVTQYGRYGRLYNLEAEARDALEKEKRGPRDFALWKAAKPGEPWWTSPWGHGRPGWHIECSTMASSIFGEHLDIHSGGWDLVFPHHENEMAQSEACFGCNQWTNYWMHTGHLLLKDQKVKMSKSLQNTIWVSELLQHYTDSEFRLFCMLRPYRYVIEYSEESMMKAVRILSVMTSFLSTADAYVRGQLKCEPINQVLLLQSLEDCQKRVDAALADDFDTPRAVQALEELVHIANIELGRILPSDQAETWSRSAGVIASLAVYVERTLNMFGIKASANKSLSQDAAEQKFNNVMEGVIKFRREVRHFALNANNILYKADAGDKDDISPADIQNMTSKERKKLARSQMVPLLEACDNLRDNLHLSGIQLKDHGKESSWVMTDEKKES